MTTMKTHERLLDRDKQPDNNQIQSVIGKEVWTIWENVHDYLKTNFPAFDTEWLYYNQQHGWAVRYRLQTQQLCLLFPERGAFTAMCMLDPEEENAVMEKINYFNVRIRETLNQPSTLPQGRLLWIRLEDHTDFFGFQLLIDVKRKKLIEF